jgi:hypothetical protein
MPRFGIVLASLQDMAKAFLAGTVQWMQNLLAIELHVRAHYT